MKVITARPFVDFKVLTNFRSKVFSNDFFYFNSGRDALLYGLKSINIHPKSSIIIPGYICNSIILPLKNAGYNLIFIDVDKELNIPLKKIDELTKLNNINALLIVNYFGFFSNVIDVVDYCKNKNIRVIEDCAHGFLSELNGRKAGSFGDISIFSKRKVLPIHDGGALKINIPFSNEITPTKSSIINPIIYLINRAVEFIIIYIRWPNIYSITIDKFKLFITSLGRHENKESPSGNNITCIQPSFFLQQYLSSNKYLNKVITNRTTNFNIINAGAIKLGYTPFCSDLPYGIVPQYSIIYDDHGGLVEFLRHNSIGASKWPWHDLPAEIRSSKANFPNAIFFDESLVMIPIHQSLNHSDCTRILQTLKLWKNIKSNLR